MNDPYLDNRVLTETRPSPINATKTSCGMEMFVKCNHCGAVYPVKISCGSRECASCMKKRARKFFDKYYPVVQRWSRVMHLTLTFKNVSVIDKERIRQYELNRKAFLKRLSRLGYIINQGIYCKELAYHASGDLKLDRFGKPIGVYTDSDCGYHYHYHLIFDGAYIDVSKINLIDIWQEVTGDSRSIALDKMNDAKHGLKYLLKYMLKFNADITHKQALASFFEITKRSRFVQTFGVKFAKIKKQVLAPKCKFCGSDDLVRNKHNGIYHFKADDNDILATSFMSEVHILHAEARRGNSLSPLKASPLPSAIDDALSVVKSLEENPDNFFEVENLIGSELLLKLLRDGHIFESPRNHLRCL